MSEPLIDSRGACAPVTRDADVHKCDLVECGTKIIGAPGYELSVTNPEDDVLRDEAGNPVLIDGLVTRK